MIDVSKIAIREITSGVDFLILADIQIKVWGFIPEEVAAPHLIMLHQQLGGVVLGAYDPSGKLIGFTYSFYGLMGKTPIQWSHMLAVLPEFRGIGLGKRLKLKQREAILERGVGICRWTFDPMEARNARLNIYTLGCTVSEYRFNFYGDSSSHLHSGLPTDRFIAHWALQSERAERCAAGDRRHEPVLLNSLPLIYNVGEIDKILTPDEPVLGLEAEYLGAPIPPDAQQIKHSHLQLAKRWREVTGNVFSAYFERGYVLVDVLSPVESDRQFFTYILKRGQK